MRTLLQDVRYGVRLLFKQPAFSVAAALVLSLGIGGSSAMFSIVNILLLKPLLIREAGQIVGCFSRDTQKPDSYRAFSYPNYADLRDNNPVFSSLMAHNLAMVGITEGDSTRRGFADAVSSNYFSTLGVPLFRGREFTSAEEQPGGSATPVAIVSYTYWRKTGADPNVIGKPLQVNGRIYTIVGIAAQGFTGTTAMVSPELYLPLGMYESVANDFEGRGQPLGLRGNHVLIVVGRLKHGVTIEAANTALALVADRLAKAYPDENKNQTILAHALARNSVTTNPSTDNGVALPAVLLISMAGIVLLIASLNVANMMLARSAARRREIAIRQSVGAARKNIFQQLLVEGLILALIGGVAGLALATVGTTVLINSLARLAPVDLVVSAIPDLRVLLATSGFCVLSALVFSLGPARNLSKFSIVASLKDGEQGQPSAGRAVFSPRNLLVMGQIALSLTLLTAAGLFLRSAIATANVAPGFRIENSLLIEVDPSLAGYNEGRGRQIYKEVLDRVRATPGVESASLAATVPFGMVQLGRTIRRSSQAPAAGSDSSKQSAGLSCRFNLVSDDYFATMGIPLLQGREFRRSDVESANNQRIVVLDELAAKRLWPDGKAVGQQLLLDALDRSGAQVVGIVGNVQENALGEGLQPHVYIPFGQEYQSDMTLHVKAASQDASLLYTIRRELLAVDNRLPILMSKTLRMHLKGSVDLWIVRTAARMFSIFGAAALLLATVGLYGLRAYTVARRTREIGIRLALGARPADAQKMILREGLVVTAIGAGAGLTLSLLAGSGLASVLYKVSAFDPLVVLVATAVLAAASMLACYVPALRASRVDPMVALRYE